MRRVCHLLTAPWRWCHHTCKHQVCNTRSAPSAHTLMSRRIAKFNIQLREEDVSVPGSVCLPLRKVLTFCVWLYYRARIRFFVSIIFFTTRTEGQRAWLLREQLTVPVREIDQDVSFFFFFFLKKDGKKRFLFFNNQPYFIVYTWNAMKSERHKYFNRNFTRQKN